MSEDSDLSLPHYSGFVYVLELEHGCMYVGYTTNPEIRLASHYLGRAAQWTRLHKPLAIKSIQYGDTQLENCLTIALMCKFGWRKVRGGRYLDVNMAVAPPPIRHAFSLKPLTKIVDAATPECVSDHNVVIQRIKDEDSDTAWRARITGEKADQECKKSGTKTLYAPSEQDLRVAVHAWLGSNGESNPHGLGEKAGWLETQPSFDTEPK